MLFFELFVFLLLKNGVVVNDILFINKKYKIISYYLNNFWFVEVIFKEYVEF